MTKPKPKIYPAEFKESAVKLGIESKRSMPQTAEGKKGINLHT